MPPVRLLIGSLDRLLPVFALLTVVLLPACQSVLWSCEDGIEDGAETGPDCGGGACPACALGFGCHTGSDCASGRCEEGACRSPATCTDGLRDGDESDIDCGGHCPLCSAGQHCTRDKDCIGSLCASAVCLPPATCHDGLRNGQETDIDCGGDCPGCLAGQRCDGAKDCADGICQSNVCQATRCHDGIKDDEESDIDCGGGTCPQCMPGGACLVPTDCQSSLCEAGHCQALLATCSLGYQMTEQGCVCDPVTCGSCCDRTEGDLCGLTFQPGANNCGAVGQDCFYCDAGQGENCEHAAMGPDYCAIACDLMPCAGCCTGPQNQLRAYCRFGDDDYACGQGGAACKVCPAGERCVANRCVKAP